MHRSAESDLGVEALERTVHARNNNGFVDSFQAEWL